MTPDRRAKVVEVAAGVITRQDGTFLLGRRAGNVPYAGYWEFPGGKVEPGESAAQALRRELEEELGIRVRHLRPWLCREHDYEHAYVRLRFFEVTAWEGEPFGQVHDRLAWITPGGEMPLPMLPANGPVLKALSLPRCMGITQAGKVGVMQQLNALEVALSAGLRFVQVREPGLDAVAYRDFAREALRLAAQAGAVAVLNTEPEFAQALGASGLHLPARRLQALGERPPFRWVGASCHTRAELEKAAGLGLDYALLGAVMATPTHPGEVSLGWEAFARLSADLPLPVLALGGLRFSDMETARNAGAHGVAAIRGAWEFRQDQAFSPPSLASGGAAGTR